MIDLDYLQRYFEPIVEADKEPFVLVSQTTFKEDGKLQIETNEEVINFKEIDNSITDDIIENSINLVAKVYPKNFIQKMFLKSKKNIDKVFSEFIEGEFIYTNQQTFDNLTNLSIYILPIIDDNLPDNIIIKGNRRRLVYFKSNKVNYNPEAFRVIKLV